MTAAILSSRSTLTMTQARRLGAALAQQPGVHVLEGEVASLAASVRPDGSWVAGTLLVRNTRVGFVAREVPGLQVGRIVVVEGRWDQHPEHGIQFDIRHCRRSILPHERRSLVRYLAANVAGLGERRAERLIAGLGEQDALLRLARDPELARLFFPRVTGEQIVHGVRLWARDLGSERWCVELAPKLMAAADVGYAIARRIVAYFDAPEVADLIARRDTYRLLEVPGFGWKRADAVARQLGVRPNAPERMVAAVLSAYDDLVSREGHTGVAVSPLVERACRLAGGERYRAFVRRAVVQVLRDCDLVRYRRLLARPEHIEQEWLIANLVDVLAQRSYQLTPEERRAIGAVVRSTNLTAEQGAAVWLVAERGVTLLTGGPGTGKTHTLRGVLDAATRLALPITIVAPTGKAATRAAEMTKRPASTIHRLLGGAPGSTREGGPLTSGVLVIEEVSMLDAEIMAWLAKNVVPGPGFRLLVVGDADQLPSVGPGRVLTDLLASGVVPTARLTAVQRQAAGSRIVQQAHRILASETLLEGETHDWSTVLLPDDPMRAQQEVVHAVRRVISQEAGSILRSSPFDARRDLQVLTPRVRGYLGVAGLNTALRPVLNARGEDGPWIAGGQRVRVGDRVMCIANDYTVKPDGLMNGEQGVVTGIVGDAVYIALDDGRKVVTRGVQNANLSLAFAATVHRAQGSEYPVVLFVYLASHAPLLDQRLLYTAVTRAKQRVVLCADRRALALSAATGRALVRSSGLAERISEMARTRPRPQEMANV